MISYEDFAKLELVIGTILEAERVPNSEKLIKLIVDIGGEKRQIVGGFAPSYPDPNILIGRQVPVLINLEPRILMGLESQGMILAASVQNESKSKPVALHPDKPVQPGTKIR